MNISPPLTMAATIRASTKGLEEVDLARRKKGWTKSEEAWAGLAITSVATLRRFCAGQPIQTKTFQEICKAVGIIDWESIADFERTDESPAKAYPKRLCFAIAGSIEEIDKNKLDAIVALLQKLGGDTSIEILDIDEGSIKLILGGSPEALEKIEALFKSGDLTEVFRSSVQAVHLLEKEELILLIKKNGGTALNLSGVNLSRANLRGISLSGASLSGADLREADFHGSDLSGADLSRADLSSVNLVEADLRESDLSEADLSNANLIRANLCRANLGQANLNEALLSSTLLSSADLSGADLSRADLRKAFLRRANLHGADLRGANLDRADLSEADLSRADLSQAFLRKTILDRARFGNNLGLSELDKSGMEMRGAIFQDSPESDVPRFVRR
jgi:uncharacterized protein YjbI with pentapeptide repeats